MPRFESSLRADGTYATTLLLEDASSDLGTLLDGELDWLSDRETPLDALLRSGRFSSLLPTLLARAKSAPSPNVKGSLTSPLVRPGKVLALGRTYREHSIELGNAPVAEPLLFEKLPDTLIGSGAAVTVPPHAAGLLDHEGELALVMGSALPAPSRGAGRAAIAGATIANDLTLRSVQKAAQRAGHPWFIAKNFPGACVLGPALVPAIPEVDLDALEIAVKVNGEVRQKGTTSHLLRRVGELVEWISQYVPLNPGDVVLTGTPAGTGALHPGDRCEVTITGKKIDFGTLVTRVV
jgi:2-keto-4-pentenoate hydratase/2-oxohepta-3-ene-1,7-dioic acid hydratase in catechol pathway